MKEKIHPRKYLPLYYRVSQKKTWEFSDEFDIVLVNARVYFMKRVKDCKDVFIMPPQDEQ